MLTIHSACRFEKQGMSMSFVETYLVPSRCLDDRTLELLVCFPAKSVKFISLYGLHPGRLTWNLQITHLERKMIFQTSMIMFHVDLQGSTPLSNASDMSKIERIKDRHPAGSVTWKPSTPRMCPDWRSHRNTEHAC